MRLSFDSIEEVKLFVKGLKGTRTGKGGDDDEGQPAATGQAPAPLQPPQGGAPGFPGAGGFAPPAAGAGPGAGGPFAPSAPALAPEVAALVNRITARIDGAIAAGQAADQVLSWFRGQCGPEAAQATMDQIKTIFLPKAAVPTLEGIAKLMNA